MARYLDFENGSESRHEYLNGEILAMTGTSLRHNNIVYNLLRCFDGVRGRCRPYFENIRVSTPSGLWAYPDVILVCGEPKVVPDVFETITNPVVIAEVLSASTRRWDSVVKSEHYRSIETLRDYLLIDQYTIDVEHRWLEAGAWKSARYATAESEITLTGVPVIISVAAVYQ